MKSPLIRTLALLTALTMSALAVWAALPPGWAYAGCWSQYPCTPQNGHHIYVDAVGRYWSCNPCSQSPSPASCYRIGNPNTIGYWCG